MDASRIAPIVLTLSLAMVGMAAPGAARAQTLSPAALSAAQEVVSLKGGGMFDPLIPNVIDSVKNAFVPTNPNLIKDLNEVAAQLRKEYEGKKAVLYSEVARIYAQHFTEQELKDLVAFYRSPLGRKMIKQEPIALDESFRRTQEWANEFSEEVMGRFRTEMKKRGHDL